LNKLNAKKKILIVGPSWVGDMVMAQSLFKLLKLQSPEMIIDVIAPEWSLPITERMPEVNNSINSLSKHNHLNLKAIFEIARGIKTAAYDQAIILPRSLKSALIPWLAKIPIRTGYRGEMRYGIINDIRAFNRNTQDQTVKRYAALGLKK
jgi:heptosyltransferase-2